MNKLAVKYFWRECWGERTVESKGLTTDLEIPGAAQNCESKEATKVPQGWYEIPFRLYLADEPQERVIAPNEGSAQSSIDSYEMPKGSLKLKPRGRKDYSYMPPSYIDKDEKYSVKHFVKISCEFASETVCLGLETFNFTPPLSNIQYSDKLLKGEYSTHRVLKYFLSEMEDANLGALELEFKENKNASYLRGLTTQSFRILHPKDNLSDRVKLRFYLDSNKWKSAKRDRGPVPKVELRSMEFGLLKWDYWRNDVSNPDEKYKTQTLRHDWVFENAEMEEVDRPTGVDLPSSEILKIEIPSRFLDFVLEASLMSFEGFYIGCKLELSLDVVFHVQISQEVHDLRFKYRIPILYLPPLPAESEKSSSAEKEQASSAESKTSTSEMKKSPSDKNGESSPKKKTMDYVDVSPPLR
ncbi:hypothetical_protein [Candidozyma auris]|uniref:hypothetical_protein n=1 Tax=Candidozyma auris TaxID=498019 RepID=UPI001257AD83|nr:hypothetical_protein [[Candida] auris]QEO24558.1 hypothetical_protein [[Candida] auris]